MSIDDQWKLASNMAQNGVWLAYYQGRSSLFLRSPQGSVQMLVDGASGAAPSGITLALNDNTPSTMWRDKIPDKGLYLKQGDKAPQELGVADFDTEPLVRFKLEPDALPADNGLHVLWYGERFSPQTNSKYNLYYRHVDTQGQASSTELILPGFYPQWIIGEGNDVAVLSWDSSQHPPRILVRVRDAQTRQFGASRVIATTTASITPVFKTFRLGKRWLVMWVEQQGKEQSDFLIRGMWSDDKGSNWSDFDFPTLKGFDIANLNMAHDPATGSAILAISGTWRLKDPTAMNAFYVTRSADNGAHWSEPAIIRDPDANKTSRAEEAHVFFGDKPGSVWAIWEDWRDVRGRLYFTYSEDYGLSWLTKNLPLSNQPKGNNIIAFNTEPGYRDTNGLHFVAANVTNDAGIEKKLFLVLLNDATLKQSKSLGEKLISPNEKALKNRIAEYWEAMAKGDYGTSYAYLDPFTRAAWPLDIYSNRRGRIKYKADIVIEDVASFGNMVDVTLRIKAYVPEFELGGKKQSMPEREVTIKERWLWIDDNWFREYSEEGSEIRFTRYR